MNQQNNDVDVEFNGFSDDIDVRTLVIPHKTPENIIQSNRLVDASFAMSIDQMRLIYLAMNKIVNPVRIENGLVPAIEISPQEFREAFNLTSNTVWERLRSITDSLYEKSIITYNTNEKGKIDVQKQRWFSSIRYSVEDSSANIILRFAPELVPHIYDLTDNFTKLDFKELAKLDTPFAMRLYQLVSQYRRFRKLRNESGIVETPEILFEELKQRVGLAGKYEQFSIFRRDVLEPAVKKINHFTDLTISYKTTLKGRKVAGLIFAVLDQKEGVKIKPVRKRLPTRPQVKSGSEREFEWALKCIDVLEQYRTELKEYDPALELSKQDLQRLLGYYVTVMDKAKANMLQKLIDERFPSGKNK